MLELATQNLTIDCGAESVPVAVEFRDRSRLSISVHPDGSVTALAPMGRTLGDVEKHLERRRSWIVKQRRHFSKYKPLPSEKKWVSGETHLYLGRQYRLRVKEAGVASVKLIGAYFEVEVRDRGDVSSIADAVERWYRSHADPVFLTRMNHCLAAAPSALAPPINLRIRTMNRRWGSCSKAGTITLNTDLIKVPIHCIDYVITHELCHLCEHNHGEAFFRLLSRCMPDWKQRKERLDSIILR